MPASVVKRFANSKPPERRMSDGAKTSARCKVNSNLTNAMYNHFFLLRNVLETELRRDQECLAEEFTTDS